MVNGLNAHFFITFRIFIDMIKKLLREELKSFELMNEIDWEKDFSDVKKTCPKVEDVVDYLNQIKNNNSKDYGQRNKFPANLPFIHGKSKLFNDGDQVDLDFFIKQITKKPNNIINTNDKILKTGGNHDFVYKTGIPAFRGIAYDISKKQFVYINTCPGAGFCQTICYALKGNYLRYPAAYDSMTRRLNYLLNYPDKYQQQMYEEIKGYCNHHRALQGYKNRVLIRWNDSGDFFSKKYVEIAENVISRLKKEGYNVDSYLYTKVASVANDNKLGSTNFSLGGNKKELSKIDTQKTKLSHIVPSDLFKDLDLLRFSDEKILKGRISSQYNIPVNTIKTYDELISQPDSNKPKWNVIISNEDGDDAAYRKDVKAIYLLQH